MKKIVQSLRRKKEVEAPQRITNDTVTEHRKRVLAGGRKFKYPIQYSRHKLVINTVIISTLALLLVGAFGWWQLYPRQNTSEFAYRVVAVVPLPVASVDGESVRYSDYLMKLRSAEHYLRQKEQATLTGDDGARQIEYLKRQAIRDTIADAYATSLARSQNIVVSDDELSSFLKAQRQSEDGEISERTYYAVISDYYNWSAAEYAHAMRAKLLRQKVSYAVDGNARTIAETAKKLTNQAGETPWGNLVQANAQKLPGVTYGASGMVPRTNQDGGLAVEAAKLKKGEVSAPITSLTGDGYYILRLVDSNERQISYEFIKIPLTVFQKQLDALYAEDKITLYINVLFKDQGQENTNAAK